VDFEWDHKKAERNLKKHSVDFADAVSIFDDLNAITLEDLTSKSNGLFLLLLTAFPGF